MGWVTMNKIKLTPEKMEDLLAGLNSCLGSELRPMLGAGLVRRGGAD